MRRTLTALTAATLMAAVPAPAIAQTGSLGSLTGSVQPTPEPEPVQMTETEQALYDALVDRADRDGYFVGAEETRAAQRLLPRVLAGEFTFTMQGSGNVGAASHSTNQGSYFIKKVSERILDSYIGDLYGNVGNREDIITMGFAVGKKGTYYYTVEFDSPSMPHIDD